MSDQKICGLPFSGFMLYVNPYNRDKIVSAFCCPSWLNPPYDVNKIPVPEDASGFLKINEIWNSAEIIKFRKSVADGSYSFCNVDKCPNLASGTLAPLPHRAQELISQGIYEVDYPPIYIQANIDRACNLQCPSCRGYHYAKSNPKVYTWLNSILSNGTEHIVINGTGELFKNQYMLAALNEIKKEDYPSLKYIDIITNGTLLNKTMWASLSEGFKSKIRRITVSVDAASKQTYEKIRVGGNFEVLLDNLYYIGTLRREDKIKGLTISFVLQKSNIHELLDFVKMVKKINADGVDIMMVENWKSQSLQDFKDNLELPDNWKNTYKDKIEEVKRYLISNNLNYYSNI
jgi:sulfatase maturation enzyme AslB (radical SAM superfamily)